MLVDDDVFALTEQLIWVSHGVLPGKNASPTVSR
jgi:hypothetical protein